MNQEKYLQKLERVMNVRRLSQSTRNVYSGQIRILLEKIGKPAGHIKVSDIQEYFEELANEARLSRSALHVAYHATRFFFSWVIFNPRVMDRTPRIRRPEAPVLQLPDRETTIRMLQSVRDPKMQVLLKLIYASGLRIGEAIRLQVQDIDSKNMRIHVRPGKTGRGRYTILSRYSLDELRAYWKQYGHRNAAPEAWLFPGRSKAGHISAQLPRIALKKALESDKSVRNTTPHTLRHCFATHLLDNGTDIRKVQQLMGHASIRSTFRYIHLTSNAFEGVTSPLDL